LKQSAAAKAATASINRMIVFIGIHRMLGELPYYLVEGIIGALRQINHSQKRAACGLLLARIRPEQTTVIAATTETPCGERLHAVGAHVVECRG
jgi:hypothetical protein